MFTTFVASAPDSDGSDTAGPLPTASSASTRPKRHQVSKACSWCRAYRIKCDDKVPCRNCVTKGRTCVEKGGSEVRTFSLAVKEINRLKSRVTELEGQLSTTRCSSHSIAGSPSLPENLDPLREHGANRASWEYLYSKLPNSQQTQCYGPASSFYFMGSMSSHLQRALAPAASETPSLETIQSASLFWPADLQQRTSLKRPLRRTNSTGATGQVPLSRWQEEYFLELFWQTYPYILHPIVDEAEFREHHNSIWIMPYEPRRPSPLVDIILALTMQHGMAVVPPDLTNTILTAEEKGKDATTAGRSYYRRCQALISNELESPSIMTLQCQIFSVIYLSNSGSHNTAHSTLAVACRIATSLGLHREPPMDDDIDEDRRNFHRRLWWTLFALEIECSMELGRPLTIKLSEVTCGLPADTQRTGLVSIPGSPDILHCYVCNSQFVKLILAARSVYVTFYEKCSEALGTSQRNTLHGDPGALEMCASFLSSKMCYLETWRRDLPESLRMMRRDGKEPLSAESSALDFQQMVPSFQQRQQIVIELQYHSLAMNLYRHFVNFAHCPEPKPLTDANAISCVEHAMTIADIIHQTLTETEFLTGCLQSYNWHSKAFMSLVGYVLAYPVGPRTAEVRTAVQKAIVTFDILAGTLSTAASAAKVARDLVTTVELVNERSHPGSMEASPGRLLPASSALCEEVGGMIMQPDTIMIDGFELAEGEIWSPSLLYSYDITGGMGWMNTDCNEYPDIWTLGSEYDGDPFNLWNPDDANKI